MQYHSRQNASSEKFFKSATFMKNKENLAKVFFCNLNYWALYNQWPSGNSIEFPCKTPTRQTLYLVSQLRSTFWVIHTWICIQISTGAEVNFILCTMVLQVSLCLEIDSPFCFSQNLWNPSLSLPQFVAHKLDLKVSNWNDTRVRCLEPAQKFLLSKKRAAISCRFQSMEQWFLSYLATQMKTNPLVYLICEIC